MNYGHHVRDLLLELKRTDGMGPTSTDAGGCTLPAYNDVSVQNALQDLKLHVQALIDQVDANSGPNKEKPSINVRPSMILQNKAILRNKRGLLAYHWVRLQRLQELHYWQARDSVATEDAETLASKHPHLSPAEAAFLHDYQNLVATYTETAIPEITSDLRAHCGVPPLTVDRVQCRVVDATPFEGPVVLESGQTVTLQQGSVHYLLYSDCEEYLRSGALQLLETEEQEG